MWKEVFHKKLSNNIIKDLLQKGKTAKLKFKNPSGESYDAVMILKDPKTGEIGINKIG
jgi:DNA topoisomerase III